MFMQLRDLGRERVTRRVWGFGKERLAVEQGGGGDWNVACAIVATERLQWAVTRGPSLELAATQPARSRKCVNMYN